MSGWYDFSGHLMQPTQNFSGSIQQEKKDSFQNWGILAEAILVWVIWDFVMLL